MLFYLHGVAFRIHFFHDGEIEVFVGEESCTDDHSEAGEQDHAHEAAVYQGVHAIAPASLSCSIGGPPCSSLRRVAFGQGLSNEVVAKGLLESVEPMPQRRHCLGVYVCAV